MAVCLGGIMKKSEGWRPLGWSNPWPEGKYLNENECHNLHEAYEAGGTAMLKAIEEKRKRGGK